MSTACKGRLRIQKLTMELRQDRNMKIIIFRNDRSDTPHLTLSWNNPTKVIDVHLKSRDTGGSEIHREIGIIPERALIKLLGIFKDKLRDDVLVELSRATKINPGRLGRWGYAVFYLDEDENLSSRPTTLLATLVRACRSTACAVPLLARRVRCKSETNHVVETKREVIFRMDTDIFIEPALGSLAIVNLFGAVQGVLLSLALLSGKGEARRPTRVGT